MNDQSKKGLGILLPLEARYRYRSIPYELSWILLIWVLSRALHLSVRMLNRWPSRELYDVFVAIGGTLSKGRRDP